MSCEKTFLGIDLGTTSVKAALIAVDGRPFGQERVEYEIIQLRPMWVEQSPLCWWERTAEAVRRLARRFPRQTEAVGAVAVSGQAPALLGLDRYGEPVGNAVIWMDRRAEGLCRERLRPRAEEIAAFSGNRPDPYFMLAKLLWLKEQRPEQYKNTACFLQANGWIVYRMTGRFSADRSGAALTQLWDRRTGEWAVDFCESAGIDTSKLPPLFECAEAVGTLTADAAEILGLPRGIPVAAGCIDGGTAPLGLSMIRPGDAFEMSGQSSGIGLVLDEPRPAGRLCLLRHAVDNRWILKGSMSASGGSLRWFRDQIEEAAADENAYERYDRMAAAVEAGAGGLIYLPYLAGERAPLWDSSARGIFFGLHFGIDKAYMVRAIMEGTAYHLRKIKEAFPEGAEITRLTGTGGGYRSRVWSQIKADVLGLPIFVQEPQVDAAAMGAALLAARAAGAMRFESLAELPVTEAYEPDCGNRERYDRGYELFCRLYEANSPLFGLMASGAAGGIEPLHS